MSTEVPNFTDYVDEVQRISKAYNSLDDQTEHRDAIEVHSKHKYVIESIGTQVSQQMPFEAKQQALNAAIEIAEFICTEGDRSTIGKAMREDLPEMPFSSTISHILDMLLPEEMAALQADGEVPRALQNLRRRFEAFALDLRIDDSIDRLWLEESDQEDDDRMAF